MKEFNLVLTEDMLLCLSGQQFLCHQNYLEPVRILASLN